MAGAREAQGRVILARLGNGASITAARGGKSMDTSMSFTPATGLPMSTRSGDLDPGLGWYLSRTENVTARQFHHMINHESGLLGVSETSSDMRERLLREKEDVRAAEAVPCFVIKRRNGFAEWPGHWKDWTRWFSRAELGSARQKSARGLRRAGLFRNRTRRK